MSLSLSLQVKPRPRPSSPPSSRDRALGFRRVLVAVVASSESEQAVDVACRLASPRSSVIALNVIEVPPLLPLDAHMRKEEAEGHRVGELALALGESYGITVVPRLVRARDAGAAIVAEAEAADCDLVVIGAERRPASRMSTFGLTVQHVLKHASCRVLVVGAACTTPGHNPVA